ncbi:MAG TPA: hypothetical protein VNG51_22630 [Ktedonobacteraceae bacterium]|nr:hypothetical protein [Ktedonobacteraceae bacterium]
MTTWMSGTAWQKQSIETQETQPLPVILPRFWKPTLQELRLHCQLSQGQLAKLAGVRLCRVYWMERGIETPLADALKVLHVLSQVARRRFHLEDMRGLCVHAGQREDVHE